MTQSKETQSKAKKYNVHEALVYIQTELNAPKNLFNKFGGYKYRNLEGITDALKPFLKETDCTFIISDNMVELNGRFYIVADATLTDSNGEERKATGWAREAENKKGMDEAQITGSSSSYARKYAANGLFAIDDTKDPDHTNKHGKDDTPKTPTAPKPDSKESTKENTNKPKLSDERFQKILKALKDDYGKHIGDVKKTIAAVELDSEQKRELTKVRTAYEEANK